MITSAGTPGSVPAHLTVLVQALQSAAQPIRPRGHVASLQELTQAAARGMSVALVAAEAGMGKSTLVAEFARRRGGRTRVLWGACDQLVTPRALGPLLAVEKG